MSKNPIPFRDRSHAGQLLAKRLKERHERHPFHQPIVFGLPRGGIPVAAEVAGALGCPLEALVVRKLGAPGNPELGIGAVTEEDFHWLDDSRALRRLGLGRSEVERGLISTAQDVRVWVERFREGRALPDIEGRDVIVVDDGIATGVTARVAAELLKAHGARRRILATPVAAKEAARAVEKEYDEVICLQIPRSFQAIGEWYEKFAPLSDDEVRRILASAPRRIQTAALSAREAVGIVDGERELRGNWVLPEHPKGIVLFAHGSGSSRLSPRNQMVAAALNRAGFATLLFDLLTEDESADRRKVFDIGLLASRLSLATHWISKQPQAQGLRLGYFGASTGAAAALVAAAQEGSRISAVVSRGGRPDLAGDALPRVPCPTLLIVGGDDKEVIELNEQARRKLKVCDFRIIPGATHLFEEPGALEDVADLAVDFFLRHLAGLPGQQKVA